MWSPAQTRVSPALSPTPSPFHGLAFFCQDLQNGGKASVASSWGPQRGLLAPGGPLGTSGGHSPHCRRAALSQESRVSLLFCVMQHPGVIGKSAGVTCSCLKWGNIIAALTLLTRCWESVKHKWQGEQRKTQKEKWRVAWLLQVSPVIKSVYSLHMNPSSHTCQL